MRAGRFVWGCLLLLAVDQAAAEADGPDRWAVSISPGSSLMLRSGPSTRFRILLRIAAGTEALENLGCSPDLTVDDWQRFTVAEREIARSLRWCRVRFGDTVGWVAGRYLVEP